MICLEEFTHDPWLLVVIVAVAVVVVVVVVVVGGGGGGGVAVVVVTIHLLVCLFVYSSCLYLHLHPTYPPTILIVCGPT